MILLQFVQLILLPSILLIIIIIIFFRSKQHPKNIPPSPPSIPVIGHLHLVILPLHQALHRLSNRYGPVLLLQFGSCPVLSITSPSAVEECFTKNDITFANRPCFPDGKHLSYNFTALAAVPYGPLFRSLRRITTMEMFSTARIRSMSYLFDEEVRLMIQELFAAGNYTKVDLKIKFSELMFNIITKIIAGKKYFGVNSDCSGEEGRQFRVTIEEMFRIMDAASPENFLPFLKWFGYRGQETGLARLARELDQIFQQMIEERRREVGNEQKTVIDVLLSLQKMDGENYSDEIIKGMILTLIAAGTHTTSAAMEWAMALLLNHPEALIKIREEIDRQVGQDRLVHHSDIQNLGYLNNVIKETLRLFPPVPLLLPHESSQECTVEGFSIPSNTMLFANAYAVHRDPKIWAEPTTFKPERFEDSEVHAGKTYFPFGLGRRSCPGEGLAMLVVGLTLGALIQCFEWERIDKEKVDLTEGSGITMPKATPLKAMCRPRQGMVDVISHQ